MKPANEVDVTPILPFCTPAAMCPHPVAFIIHAPPKWEKKRQALTGYCTLCCHSIEHTRDSDGNLTGVWVLWLGYE